MRKMLKNLSLLLILLVSGFLFSGCNPLERKNKAGLQVITDDQIVSIFIDDQFLGKSPFLTKDLKPGEYSIKLEPENDALTTYETSITLRKGMLSVITWKPGPTLTESGGVIYELERLPDKNATEVSVLSIPDNAILSIDGGNKQFAPYTQEGITEGSHDFEVSLPSYETQNHTINVVKGHRLNILVKLAKEGILTNTAQQESDNTVTESKPAEATNAATLGITDELPTSSPQAQPLRQAPTDVTLGSKQVTIKSTNYFENGVEVLKVRDASTSAGKVIGTVEVGKDYPYLEDQTNNWIKLSLGTKQGWVSSLYAEIK